jgi:hypothetical protein
MVLRGLLSNTVTTSAHVKTRGLIRRENKVWVLGGLLSNTVTTQS